MRADQGGSLKLNASVRASNTEKFTRRLATAARGGRGAFTNAEVNRFHAEAFETRLFDETEWNWRELTASHSLGWITARCDGELVGFAHVPWDEPLRVDSAAA